MKFPNTFSADIREHGRKFTSTNINALRDDTVGVYILFYNRHFVYVGQSKRVKKRLTEHYDGSSNEKLGRRNEKLRIWLGALDGDVKFTYISCRTDEIDDLESSLICYLQPITNEKMYSSYRPKPTEWIRTHG